MGSTLFRRIQGRPDLASPGIGPTAAANRKFCWTATGECSQRRSLPTESASHVLALLRCPPLGPDPDHLKAGKPEVFVQLPGGQIQPAFSPDGRWIAYLSDENGIRN